MARMIDTRPVSAITMDISEVAARRRRLEALAAELGTVVDRRRVEGGTSTAAAIAAAQDAADAIFTGMRAAANNLKAMGSMLDRRLQFMREFGKEYPMPYATPSDARKEAAALATLFAKDPKHAVDAFDQLRRYAIDPDFAAGFVKKVGADHLVAFFQQHPSNTPGYVPWQPDFSSVFGVLLGAAAEGNAFSKGQLGAVIELASHSPSVNWGLDFGEFYKGVIRGGRLEPATIGPVAGNADLVNGLIHIATLYAGGSTPPDEFLTALDLALARHARAGFTLLAGPPAGNASTGGLHNQDLQAAIAVLLSDPKAFSADRSRFVHAIAAVQAEQLAALPKPPKISIAESVAEFDDRFRQFERAMKNVERTVRNARVGTAAERDAAASQFHQALYTGLLAAAEVALVASGVGAPLAVGTMAIGAASGISVGGSHEADELAARLGLNDAAAAQRRELAFAIAKLNHLRAIKAPASDYPNGYQTAFRYDPKLNSFVLQHPDAARQVLNQDELYAVTHSAE